MIYGKQLNSGIIGYLEKIVCGFALNVGQIKRGLLTIKDFIVLIAEENGNMGNFIINRIWAMPNVTVEIKD